ncbi:hypothetical protein F4679DRAFT_525687 [Xylaria curta]|nr:hypothetical protein F4679DRAFT_525687 [Xylaria curta]
MLLTVLLATLCCISCLPSTRATETRSHSRKSVTLFSDTEIYRRQTVWLFSPSDRPGKYPSHYIILHAIQQQAPPTVLPSNLTEGWNKQDRQHQQRELLLVSTMEPWTRVMSKLTGTTTYTIEDKGCEWWQFLEHHTIMEDTIYGPRPLTVALVAQVKPGARRYNLQAGGKDAPVWDLITANIPEEMVGYGIKGKRFEWDRISLAWIYCRNNPVPTAKYIRIMGEF